MSYNGWNNYETWLFWCHMSNDGFWYEHMNELAQEVIDNEDDAGTLANLLRDFMNDEIYGRVDATVHPLIGDIIESIFGEVDWREIADSLLQDAKEAAEF